MHGLKDKGKTGVFPHHPAYLSSSQALLRKAAGVLRWWLQTRSGPEPAEGHRLSLGRRQQEQARQCVRAGVTPQPPLLGWLPMASWSGAAPTPCGSSEQAPMELASRQLKTATCSLSEARKKTKPEKEKPKRKSLCLSQDQEGSEAKTTLRKSTLGLPEQTLQVAETTALPAPAPSIPGGRVTKRQQQLGARIGMECSNLLGYHNTPTETEWSTPVA